MTSTTDPIYESIHPPSASSKNNPVPLELLQKRLPLDIAQRIYTDKVKDKPLFLHPTTIDKRQQRKIKRQQELSRKRKPKPLSAREKRALKVHEIPKNAQTYALYISLHELWKGYMKELLGTLPCPNAIVQKMVKADYHGSILSVVKSKCPSRVGVCGICIKETKGTFVLITKQDKMITVPKENSVFRFELEFGNEEDLPMVLDIYGNHFSNRSAERMTKKLKCKATIDL